MTSHTHTHTLFLTHSNNWPSVAGCQKFTPSRLLWRSGALPGATGATNYLALTPPSRATTASTAHQNTSSFVQSLFRPDIYIGRAQNGIEGALISHVYWRFECCDKFYFLFIKIFYIIIFICEWFRKVSCSSLAGISSSNPTAGLDVCPLWGLVLSGRVFYDGPIPRSGESCRVWCVYVT